MANRVDPNQTEGAVCSGSALFAYAILSDTLVYEMFGHLPNTLDHFNQRVFASFFLQRVCIALPL